VTDASKLDESALPDGRKRRPTTAEHTTDEEYEWATEIWSYFSTKTPKPITIFIGHWTLKFLSPKLEYVRGSTHALSDAD